MGILSFLFGKSAKIFNKKGEVHHDLGDKKWQDWDNRLKDNPDYNWRAHKGKNPNESQEPTKTAKPPS